MPVSTLVPYLIGFGSVSAGATVTITPAVPVPAGDLVVVLTDNDLHTAGSVFSNVTDTQSNTYGPAVVFNYPNPAGAGCYSPGVKALSTSDTITVNWSTAEDINAVALGVSGADKSSPLDQRTANWTYGPQLSLVTRPLGLNHEIAVAYWASRNAQGAPEITSDWTSVSAFQGAANTHWVNLAWKLADTTDPVTASASTPASGLGFTGILLTFRAQVTATATLHCGGGLAASPATPVNATATLHCGGSLPQAAELAPAPPPAPPAFPAGYGPYPADMETWVRAPLRYCTNGICFRAQQTGTGQAVPAATFTALAFPTVLEDPFGGWSASATTAQPANSWLAPYTAWYRITFRYTTLAVAGWQDAAVAVSGATPTLEGGGVANPAAVTGGAALSVVVPLIGGADWVQLLAWSTASATTDTTTAGRQPYVEIEAVQTDLQP